MSIKEEIIVIDINYFLKMIEEDTKEKVIPLLDYLDSYEEVYLDEEYSYKTKIPTWRKENAFVKIACRKSYISIYFSNRDSVEFIKENFKFCRVLKSCVNLSYKREIPYDIIKKAIDICFENKK